MHLEQPAVEPISATGPAHNGTAAGRWPEPLRAGLAAGRLQAGLIGIDIP